MGPRLKTPSGTFNLYITSFSTVIRMGSEVSQLRRSQSHYPIKPSQPNFSFVTQFNSQANAQLFQQMVRSHHISALDDNVSQSKIRFNWPERNMSYEGYILETSAGEKRFDIAPEVSVEMLLVKDLFSSTTTTMNQSSGVEAILGDLYEWTGEGEWLAGEINNMLGSWQDAFGGSLSRGPSTGPGRTTPRLAE